MAPVRARAPGHETVWRRAGRGGRSAPVGTRAVAGHPVVAPRRYVVEPMPRYRAVVLDRLIGASRRFPVHALVEFDVEEARARLAASSQACTWTGFVVATIGRAVA